MKPKNEVNMMSDLRLLLVDDEQEFLEPMAARLARRSISCVTAQSGQDALKFLAKEQFACAVVDVRMPGMDGLELLRIMRKDFSEIPVILLTGHASVELGVQGMELGAFDYLMKPVDLDELLDTVRRAVEETTLTPGGRNA
jgi:two-component system OmpR family response regulator